MRWSTFLELVELECRNCGGPLSASDFAEKLGVVRCPSCQAIYAVKQTAPAAAATPARVKARVAMPEGFSVEDSGRELVITRKWFSGKYLFLLVFAIGWNAFMVVWHTMALSSGAWFMSLFGLIHTAVGLGLIYSVAAGFLNHTEIRVGAGRLRVHHGPLPWSGGLDWRADRLRQLFAKERVRHGKNRSHTDYSLRAIDEKRRMRTVLKGLPSIEHAVFLEQEIERFLEIGDTPVAGEAHA
ncbi:MAG: hypothetical protein AAF488_01400 [Planctomycetota bacterium]